MVEESLNSFLGIASSDNVKIHEGRSKKYKATRLRILNQLLPLKILISWKDFLIKVPRRAWNFYIEAFLIPSYREEWGEYKKWSFRSPLRPKTERKSKRKIHKPEKHLKKCYIAEEKLKPVRHDHSLCQVARINISGMIFEPQIRTLNHFPGTLLGDPIRRVQFFDPIHNEYFFDRSRVCFEAIMYYYQTGGVLRRPFNVSTDMFMDEMKFFDLGEKALHKFMSDEGYVEEVEEIILPKNLLKRKLWLLFEYPESSLQAKVLGIFSVTVIVLSIVEFCIETLPEFDVRLGVEFTNEDNGTNSEDKLLEAIEASQVLRDPFFFVETVCICWFALEFIMRCLSCPDKWDFFKKIPNVIDLFSIPPYFFEMLYKSQGHDPGNITFSFAIFRAIRIDRVFRILKLSRHNRGLKVLGKTLKASRRELGILSFFLFLGVLVFSSAVFLADGQTPGSKFKSIPETFWWAVTTMTTVGYGDVVPISVWGKVIGSLCAVAGVLTLAFPVPVIVSNFNSFYHKEEIKKEVAYVECDHVTHCPFLSAQYRNDGSVIKFDNKCHHGDIGDGEVESGDEGGDDDDDDDDDEHADKYSMAPWKMAGAEDDQSDSDFEDLKQPRSDEIEKQIRTNLRKT